MRPRTPPLGPRESSDFASGEFALPFVPVPPTPTSNVRQEDLRLRVHLPGSRAEDLDRSQSLGDGFFSPSNSFRALPGVERSRLKFGLVMLLLLFLSGFTILNMFLNEITANDAQVRASTTVVGGRCTCCVHRTPPPPRPKPPLLESLNLVLMDADEDLSVHLGPPGSDVSYVSRATTVRCSTNGWQCVTP